MKFLSYIFEKLRQKQNFWLHRPFFFRIFSGLLSLIETFNGSKIGNNSLPRFLRKQVFSLLLYVNCQFSLNGSRYAFLSFIFEKLRQKQNFWPHRAFFFDFTSPSDAYPNYNAVALKAQNLAIKPY